MTLKRTPLKRKGKINKVSVKQKEKNVIKAERTKERHNIFLEIWEERKEYTSKFGYFCRCFETGDILREQYFKENSCCYHHCLEKNIYPEFDLVKENIVIVHPDIHDLIHLNIDKTPNVKQKTKELKIKLLNL